MGVDEVRYRGERSPLLGQDRPRVAAVVAWPRVGRMKIVALARMMRAKGLTQAKIAETLGVTERGGWNPCPLGRGGCQLDGYRLVVEPN